MQFNFKKDIQQHFSHIHIKFENSKKKFMIKN